MIEKHLQNSGNPAILLSGGLDSTVLLSMVREVRPDIAIYCFSQNFTKEQFKAVEKLIELWDLQVMSIPPANSYIIPDGSTLARCDEYNLGGVLLPVIRDFIESPERCALALDETKLPFFEFDHDVVFIGSRESDKSFATGRVMPSDVVNMGRFKLVAPLWKMSREEVEAEAMSRGLTFLSDESLNSGNLLACSKCMQGHEKVFCHTENKEIESREWQPAKMLSAFREKFGFQGEQI